MPASRTLAPITPAFPPESELELLRQIQQLRKKLHFVEAQLGRCLSAIKSMGAPLTPTATRKR
jgi:hypothetical protein